MHRALVVAALLVTGLAGASTAQAMSCNNRLIVVGDPSVRVRGLCGEPAEITERVVERSREHFVRGRDGILGDRTTVSVVVQHWVYDFGPGRFMRELVFEGNRLVAIRTLGYGTARAEAPPVSRELDVPLAGPRRSAHGGRPTAGRPAAGRLTPAQWPASSPLSSRSRVTASAVVDRS